MIFKRFLSQKLHFHTDIQTKTTSANNMIIVWVSNLIFDVCLIESDKISVSSLKDAQKVISKSIFCLFSHFYHFLTMELVVNSPDSQKIFNQLINLSAETHGWSHQPYDYKFYSENFDGYWLVAVVDKEKGEKIWIFLV